MSTVVAVGKRRRRRDFKPKPPFFGPKSSGPSILPSFDTRANLPELFALLRMQQEADQDERPARPSSHCAGPSESEERQASSASEVVTGEDELILREKPELAESDVAVAREVRRVALEYLLYPSLQVLVILEGAPSRSGGHDFERRIKTCTPSFTTTPHDDERRRMRLLTFRLARNRRRVVSDLHPTATDAATRPGRQFRGMSTAVAVPERRRREFKEKLPFFVPNNGGPNGSPLSNTQANLPELFALLTTQQEANEDERRTTLRGKIDARPSLDSCAEPSKERDARTPEVVIEVVAECETPEPNALVEPDEVVDEGARSPAGIPAEYPSLFLEMLEGGLQTACLYGPPTGTPSAARGPVRLRPYYQHPDNDEDERELSTPVQDAATACSCPALSTDSGRPCAVACDGEPWLVPSRSSSDRHYEAVEDVYVFLGNYRDLQTLLIAMRMRGLTDKAEYLVIMIDHDIDSWEEFNHNFFGKVPEKDIRALSEACSQLLVILPRPPAGDSYSEFIEKVREYNQKPPFNFPPGPTIFKKHITQYASYLFDSVMLYADAVTSLIRKNHNISDGQAVIREIIGRKRYKSVTTAEMSITPKGDVEGNYTVLAFLPVSDEAAIKVRNKLVEARRASHSVIERLFQPAGGFKYVDDETAAFDPRVNDSLLWKTGQPPLAEPPCGYDGSGCNAPVDNRREILASVLGVLLILVSVFATIVYRNWKYEQEIAGLLWMIDKRELEPLTTLTGPKHGISKLSLISQMVSDSRMMNLSEDTYRYRGTMTYVKKLVYHRRSADIPRAVKKEMKLMRELHHENLNPFVGACVEPNCIYAVSELCVKGNLQDILENDVIKLDNMFIASFVFDIIKGLRYLHESDLRVHGNLRSTNVLVTNLWVLRLTNFGLLELRATNAAARANRDDKEDYQLYRSQLWRSPEVLRNPSHYPRGSQKDDMYAFAIILHEIIGRQGPWGSTRLEPKAIIDKVKAGGDPPFRPPVSDLQCQDYVLSVISDCWAEKPDARPELSQVQERLKKMRQGMKPNIMDNLMALMEKYANNLEELVTERTCLLEEEKKKTEALLHRMLPKTVALQLMRGQMVVPESFDAVTIYFSDIVGFTEMSATSTPLEVVNFLNELYTCFDSIIRHYDVYKVETIGDAYMVVSGLPERNGDAHAREVASMALEILDAVRHFTIRHRPGATLKLRIGIHSGPVVAGVVGLTMPRYCLFGDTVNTASRMESNGEALKIHISSQCRDLLVKIGGYDIADRGLVKMKGKGELRTYWLLGHKAGPQHRRAEDGNQFLPAPLFNVGDGGTGGGAMAAPHRSPKTEGLPRRGSLIPKLSDHDTDLLGTALMNGSVMGGIQALHRLKQDSPGILRPKPSRESSFTHKGPRRHEFLEAPSSRTNSVADLDGGLILPRRNESTLSPCAKDEFGCSNPDLAVLRARQWAADRGKNGLKSLDESARPLLRDASTNCNGNGGGHLLSLAEDAAKRWRSCDEIAALAPTRDKLKKVFTGLLRAGASRDKSRDWDSTAVDAGGGLPRLVCESAEDTTESIV
ncbi:hypothetical protein HPB52_001575 [Rhipicephalus sanguineus]|uniref:Guanylate cyclase n=1 Tax=Rhipicephalus sanguineus TaxID=34632 RepID=A0A9D4PHX0_RHISA|nr:hypothetical protein HPB52_001575 [Rhipicephalus sanguineus]